MSEATSKKTRKKDVKKAMRTTIRKRGRIKSKKLVKKTEASSTGWSKVEIKELLQNLAKKKKNKVRLEEAGAVVVWDDATGEQAFLPIAQQIARMNLAASTKNLNLDADSEGESSVRTEPSSTKDTTDLDEEIRRLEAELAEDDMEEDESDGGSVSRQNDVAEKKVSFASTDVVHQVEAHDTMKRKCIGPAVLSLSSLADERIAPLPQSALPAVRKRTLKGVDGPLSKKPKPSKELDGLRGAVKELLDGYVARSKEKLSGYCRVCAEQFETDEEFHAHRKTEFHKLAVEMERKATYCKLCRKQFTSPVQMKEHLSSRPHREQLAFTRQRQNNQRGRQQSAGRRQWC